jgi:hypothetical protein
MKTSIALSVAFALVLSAGCATTVRTETVTVRVKVVDHAREPSWDYSELLYRVLEPSDLAGRSGFAATRKAAPPGLEGREYKLRMDSKMLERLCTWQPEEYWSAPPSSKNPDFLKVAEPMP